MKNFFASLKGVVVLGLVMCWGVGWGQSGKWIWMKGDSIGIHYSLSGTYGSIGIASIANKPGARTKSVTWTDNAGMFWLFGGMAYDANTPKYYNDLWKYNEWTNEWTWVNGDSTLDNSSVYGTKNVTSTLNKPGGRNESTGWVDASGNLWMFGGVRQLSNIQYNYYNDLWRYNPNTNQWTWVNGDSVANTKSNYGLQGIASLVSKPGGRQASVGWADSVGNIWLFGGMTYTIFKQDKFNDLWKYNIGTDKWAWMKGDSTTNRFSIHGAKGISNGANMPGGRFGSISWIDRTGNLWLFGGAGIDQTFNQAEANDLWKYNVTTNEWTWMSGDSVSMASGVYGIKGVSTNLTKPGARHDCVGWKDSGGNFWLFGGYGTATTHVFSDLNDLWNYNLVTNQWTWVNGDSLIGAFGIYGVKGSSSPITKPGTRWGCKGWADVFSTLWLFGGYGYAATTGGYLNDLWMYTPEATLFPLHLLTFTAKRVNTANLLNWTTAQEVNTDHFDIERSPNGTQFSKIGTVKANNNSGQYEYTDNQTRNEKQETVVFYRLKMLDKDGQFTYSPILQLTINHSQLTIALFPNPAKDNLQLQIESDQKAILNLQVLAQDGKIVLSKRVTVPQGSSLQSLNISQLAAGHYFLKALSADKEPVLVGFEKVR